MSNINFNLVNASNLTAMAPPALGGGMFGVAALPGGLAGAGMYIIWNTHTNNRYAGISTNLTNRFNTRMETITELGFSAAQMAQIIVFWGTAQVQNSPTLAVPAPPLLGVVGYAAPLNILIDGVYVNLERLLIRFVLTQLGGGGTVSNNMLAFAPYVNPMPNPSLVTLNWGAVGGGGGVAAGAAAAVWPVGGFGW